MKILTILLLGVFCVATLSKKIYNQEEFQESFKAWKKLKTCSYSYVTSRSSWTLYHETTKISVARNKVVRREFESYTQTRGTYEKQPLESWVESTPAEVGSHESGFAPQTMEDLYTYCKKEVLTQNPEENTMYFETFENGIIKQCGFFPLNCADDCFQGFTLDELTLN